MLRVPQGHIAHLGVGRSLWGAALGTGVLSSTLDPHLLDARKPLRRRDLTGALRSCPVTPGREPLGEFHSKH